MFSPATRKSHFAPRAAQNIGHGVAPESPSTPVAENRPSISDSPAIHNRPVTGTPAPWASGRLSVIARIPPLKRPSKGADADQIDPVYVGEFPQIVREAQANFMQKGAPGDVGLSGGFDRGTSLSWIICGDRLFIWNFFSSSVTKNCVVLDIPFVLESENIKAQPAPPDSWMVSIIKWDCTDVSTDMMVQCNSAGIVICNKKTEAVIYWPDIYSGSGITPISSHTQPDGSRDIVLLGGKPTSGIGNGFLSESSFFNSMIASAIPGCSHECLVLACRSNGELWRFHCTASRIGREKVSQVFNVGNSLGINSDHSSMNKGYARSLVWRFNRFVASEKSIRQFFLLTDHEIQCWEIQLGQRTNIARLWAHEIVGTDGDLGIKKDLAGQKHIWLLDMQVDERGKELTVLTATFCKDRVSSSSYTQYSLLTMLYKSGHLHERVLEKKSPIQVIIPKARVEDEEILFSMRLRLGGKPPGSTIVLSGDGTATVTNYWRGSTRLYQFDLPYDAGKVLDASVLPPTEDSEEGAWVVLTEKAGMWAIPERAVLLGGVEPPERSLSRKGSSKEGAAEEEKRTVALGANIAPRRVSSEAWDTGNRQRAAFTGVPHRTAQDEESEAVLGRLFNDFLSNGLVEGSFEKLKVSGAFEKDGETNVFARASKSIIDTLAKHWTTTRGPEIVAMAVLSSQLLDKQQKHTKFLQFLALSKCHEELSARQRHSLQTIMEHGEKLASMIQLRELQTSGMHNQSSGEPSCSSPANGIASPLWDLIQLVGEKSRRNTVLLMDRDNAEVFYTKVSELEEIFNCLSHDLKNIVRNESLLIQIQRACILAAGSSTLVRTAMNYRSVHHTWYPSPEGLTPWYCQPVVRSGLWTIASFIIQLKEGTGFGFSSRPELYSHLEELTDVLLETYSGAITAKIERKEEHKGLVDEYWNKRDILLDSLYEQVKGSVEAKHQNSGKDTNVLELKEGSLKELSSPLLSIARRHEGYATLWKICCDLNDTDLLRSLMRESVGPKRGYSYFVFKQLYKRCQYAKLLRLGEEFQEELATFLKQHKQLLWLHELFLHHFSSASETLHALALSHDGSSALAIDEGFDSLSTKFHSPSLVDRKRLLNLSKIAAVAGGEAGFETKTKRIEADQNILKLQEEIMNLFPCHKENLENKLLSPGELIKVCLNSKNRKLSLQAFNVFAWTSYSFIKLNKSLLEECWRTAIDQDNWAQLYQASITEGWSDEMTLGFLRETILFHASEKCYAPQAEVYEGGFEEILPLQKVGENVSVNDHSSSSVEGILMQHKDFPDAGKLMLTAVMMGKFGSDFVPEERSPME